MKKANIRIVAVLFFVLLGLQLFVWFLFTSGEIGSGRELVNRYHTVNAKYMVHVLLVSPSATFATIDLMHEGYRFDLDETLMFMKGNTKLYETDVNLDSRIDYRFMASGQKVYFTKETDLTLSNEPEKRSYRYKCKEYDKEFFEIVSENDFFQRAFGDYTIGGPDATLINLSAHEGDYVVIRTDKEIGCAIANSLLRKGIPTVWLPNDKFEIELAEDINHVRGIGDVIEKG